MSIALLRLLPYRGFATCRHRSFILPAEPSLVHLRTYTGFEPEKEGAETGDRKGNPLERPSKTQNHWTEASPDDKHWLDRRLPGLREWLEGKNEKLWLQGVGERCRQYSQLEGKENFIMEQLSKKYAQYLSQYRHLVVDERSNTHLQMGALMLATKSVLSPWIKNIRDVEDIIKSHMGDFTSPMFRFLLRYVLYLSRDPYLSTKRRLHGLRLDYGKAFATELREEEGAATLEITDCFYQRLFKSEGCEHLLSACCCSQDRVWFENLHSHGIKFEKTCWKGSGDRRCILKISNSNALPSRQD